MDFDDILAKTTLDAAFSDGERVQIVETMLTAYEGSATAKAMFDDWIAGAGHTIKIDKRPNDARAFLNTGHVEIDVAFFNDNTYIDDNGKGVEDTLLSGLIHELGHALKGKDDNYDATDYKGDNVNYVNQIYDELGIPEQNSYIAYDSDGTRIMLGFEYTNGAAIDRSISFNRDMSTAPAGNSSDLLVDGSGSHQPGSPYAGSDRADTTCRTGSHIS